MNGTLFLPSRLEELYFGDSWNQSIKIQIHTNHISTNITSINIEIENTKIDKIGKEPSTLDYHDYLFCKNK